MSLITCIFLNFVVKLFVNQISSQLEEKHSHQKYAYSQSNIYIKDEAVAIVCTCKNTVKKTITIGINPFSGNENDLIIVRKVQVFF